MSKDSKRLPYFGDSKTSNRLNHKDSSGEMPFFMMSKDSKTLPPLWTGKGKEVGKRDFESELPFHWMSKDSSGKLPFFMMRKDSKRLPFFRNVQEDWSNQKDSRRNLPFRYMIKDSKRAPWLWNGKDHLRNNKQKKKDHTLKKKNKQDEALSFRSSERKRESKVVVRCPRKAVCVDGVCRVKCFKSHKKMIEQTTKNQRTLI